MYPGCWNFVYEVVSKSSKSKPSCSLLEALSSKNFLFKCPACINNLLTLKVPILNAPTLTATTQTTVTNATYNTKFEDNINTILATLKSHIQQIQSLMTHNNNLTNKLNNNISHHDTHFTPTLLTSPPNTNYNNHFPNITNTLKHNSHTNYINIPKLTNHPQRRYTETLLIT